MQMQFIAFLTSDEDGPGMNARIWAIIGYALHAVLVSLAIYDEFKELLAEEMYELMWDSLSYSAPRGPADMEYI